MSHVVKIEVTIKSLESLERAAQALGLEFVRGQRNFKWYGEFMGDAPVPA